MKTYKKGNVRLQTCYSGMDYPDFHEAVSLNEGQEVSLRMLE